jgi:hypothetical protein
VAAPMPLAPPVIRTRFAFSPRTRNLHKRKSGRSGYLSARDLVILSAVLRWTSQFDFPLGSHLASFAESQIARMPSSITTIIAAPGETLSATKPTSVGRCVESSRDALYNVRQNVMRMPPTKSPVAINQRFIQSSSRSQLVQARFRFGQVAPGKSYLSSPATPYPEPSHRPTSPPRTDDCPASAAPACRKSFRLPP